MFLFGLPALIPVGLTIVPNNPEFGDTLLVICLSIAFYHLVYATLVLLGFYGRFIKLIDVGLANRSDPVMEDLRQRLVRYKNSNGKFVIQSLVVAALCLGWSDFRQMGLAYLVPLVPLFIGFSTLACTPARVVVILFISRCSLCRFTVLLEPELVQLGVQCCWCCQRRCWQRQPAHKPFVTS